MRLNDAYEAYRVLKAITDLTWLMGFKIGKLMKRKAR